MVTKTETLLDSLKINYLTEEQYNTALENDEINENEIYMTPSSESSGGTDDYDIIIEFIDEEGYDTAFDIGSIVQNGSSDILTVFNKVYYKTGTPKVLLKSKYYFSYGLKDASICMPIENIIAHKTYDGHKYPNCGMLGFTINFTYVNEGYTFPHVMNSAEYGFLIMYIDLSTGVILEQVYESRDVMDARHPQAYNLTIGSRRGGDNDDFYACTFGSGLWSRSHQYVFGHYNDETLATDPTSRGTDGTAFVIGNGTYDYGDETNYERVYHPSNACRITYEGQVIGKMAYSATGADYAEYFEWADANVDNEERIGYFVTFEDGRFIRKANENDYILGIVSGNPAILGNHDECWMGRNEMDEWGRFIYETKTKVDEETKEEHTYTTYKVNPEYDRSMQYVPRSERPEWATIGMLGVLAVRDDGTCQVNGYCKVADGGIATASDTGYRVIERVTDNIIKVVFR